MDNKIMLITNERNWLEQNALDQLQALSRLPGIVRVAGLPDLHAGKTPIGVVAEVEGMIYPHLIGNDLGCGMGLFQTGIPSRRYQQERWVTKLNHIRMLADLPCDHAYGAECPIADLGTIGSGNHFAEFQQLHEVVDRQVLAGLGLDRNEILLLVHSGARGYGQRILSMFPEQTGLRADVDTGKAYLALHQDALLWAERNRRLVAEKLVCYLGFSGDIRTVLDCPHNFMEERQGLWLHRKGTVSAERGMVVIPGSRGSLTYLVQPTEQTAQAIYSLSHGAGRKWARSLCRGRIQTRYDRESIRTTKLKSKVVCHDTKLLFEEAPEAYKNIEQVIDCLVEAKLLTIVATLKPLITYKG